MKRSLVRGASGFLGWDLCQGAKSHRMVFGTFLSHPINIPDIRLLQIDLTKFRELKQLFKEVEPDAVIHTAGITDPDFFQKNRSHKINTEAAIDIAGLCSDLEIPCLFTSPDLVFDGLNPPHTEEDEPSPIGVYGEQKVLAE